MASLSHCHEMRVESGEFLRSPSSVILLKSGTRANKKAK
jgi:hypothetical protein